MHDYAQSINTAIYIAASAAQESFRGLLQGGQLEDRVATFELPVNTGRMNNFDGMGGVAMHELMVGYVPVLGAFVIFSTCCLYMYCTNICTAPVYMPHLYVFVYVNLHGHNDTGVLCLWLAVSLEGLLHAMSFVCIPMAGEAAIYVHVVYIYNISQPVHVINSVKSCWPLRTKLHNRNCECFLCKTL